MRYVNNYAFNAATNATSNSASIDTNQWVAASFQATFSDNTAAGTLQLQFSNDVGNSSLPGNLFTPTNWTNVPGTTATAAVTSGAAPAMYIPTNFVARWLRVSYTRSGGSGTFSVTYQGFYP